MPELVTLDDVEVLIASLPEPDPNYLSVLRAGERVPPQALRTRDAAPSLPAVRAAVRSGYTVQLAKLQRRHAPIAQLCRRIEAAFVRAGVPLTRHAGSHLYLTPPGSIGLRPHYDNHSVIAIQVAGRKIWRMREPLGPIPSGRQPASLPQDVLDDSTVTQDLGPGEVLYVPRGWIHDARSGAELSIHITIDLYPLTWLDVAGRCVRAHSELGSAVPSDSASADDLARLRRLMSEAIDERSVATALANARADFLAMVAPLPGRGLRDLLGPDDITLTTEMQPRPEALTSVIERQDGAMLALAGTELEAPIEAASLLRFIAAAETFTPADLPGLADDAARVALARELVVAGAAEIARPD